MNHTTLKILFLFGFMHVIAQTAVSDELKMHAKLQGLLYEIGIVENKLSVTVRNESGRNIQSTILTDIKEDKIPEFLVADLEVRYLGASERGLEVIDLTPRFDDFIIESSRPLANLPPGGRLEAERDLSNALQEITKEDAYQYRVRVYLNIADELISDNQDGVKGKEDMPSFTTAWRSPIDGQH